MGLIIDKFSQVPLTTISKINGIGLSAVGEPSAGQISKINDKNIYLNPVPEGLIIAFNSSGALPSGWSLFNSADGKYIIGAGSTYAVADNGAGTGNHQSSVAAIANHTATTTLGDSGSSGGNSPEGGHGHTTSAFAYTPPYQGAKLIKADTSKSQIPQYGVTWSHSGVLAGVANIWTDGYYFQAAASLGTGGSNTVTGVSTDAAGSHDHIPTGVAGAGGGYGGRPLNPAGSHSHSSITITMSPNLYRYAMAAWHNASADYDLVANMIAMYESVTPPAGWYLCDGNNGTPDLRDRFVTNVAQGAEASAGDGQVTASSAALAHATHHHQAANADPLTAFNHAAYAMASHSGINDSYTWLPPYYALAFIMYGG